jgi:cobalt-zinc-cadmium efflux system outer membrane protein
MPTGTAALLLLAAVPFAALASSEAPAVARPRLTLDRAVERALATGDIAAQAARVDEASGQLLARTARPRATFAYDRQDVFDHDGAPGFAQDVLRLEQALPAPGLVRRRRQVASDEIAIARWEADVLVRQKTYQTRKAYAAALAPQRLVEAIGAGLEPLGEAVRIVSARVAAGESSPHEQVRVELAGVQERDLIAAARVEEARALSVLGTLMGESLPAGVFLEGDLPAPAANEPQAPAANEPQAPAGLPELAVLASRADLARDEEALSRREARPQLTAGLGAMHFDQTALAAQSGYNAVLAVQLPVDRRRRGEVRAARARAAAALRSREALERRVRAEVDGTSRRLDLARERLDRLAGEQEGLVDSSLQLSRIAYQAGLTSLLELLDAHRAAREFRVARLRAQAELLDALEDHAYALGTVPGTPARRAPRRTAPEAPARPSGVFRNGAPASATGARP